MITVIGASGHIGKALAGQLLAAGEKVRAVARSADKLAPLAAKGAEVLAGNATDAAFLARAFQGATAAFAFFPPDPQSDDYGAAQDRMGEAIISAMRTSGIGHVVFMSSIGADVGQGAGLIAGLHRQEERFKALSGANVLLLRPGFFMTNFEFMAGLIKSQGIAGGGLAADMPLPMIAPTDIATVAVKALRSRDWTGIVVRDLLGPRNLTLAEATSILGQRIGRPELKYVQFNYADLEKALLQMGMKSSYAGLYVEMCRGFNEGKLVPRLGRSPDAPTPTRFEDFTDELAKAF
jgi:uncharacterized protein YbjT (DUF2867 family)